MFFDMNKEILQTLKILPIDIICPFEWNTNSSYSIECDEVQLIRHPFLVTPIAKGKYLLLEESSEFYILKQAGISQVPVQIIQNDQVRLHQKSIGVYSFDGNDLQTILSNNSRQIKSELESLKTNEKSLVRLYYEDKKYFIKSIQSSLGGCPISVSILFSYFEKNGGYRMMQQQGSLSDSLMKVHHFAASIELPKVTFADIVNAVDENNLYPQNVLEVRADVRILYIDFPISTLISDNLIFEKEVFLRDLILLREQAEKTSTYQGKVYLLNR